MNKDRILWIVMMALIVLGAIVSGTGDSGWTVVGNSTVTNYTAQVSQCLQFSNDSSYKVCLEEN